jgi:hypothetical protein
MSMWSWAMLCLNLVCASGTSPVGAYAGDQDGCAILAAIIADEALRGTRLDLGGSALVGNSVDTHTCDQTARSVTDAFSGALSNLGIRIVWGARAIEHQTICDSADLIRCMPRVLPSETAVSSRIVVHDSWAAVQHSVHNSMPFGSASDVSYFNSSALRTSIGRALDQKLTVPSHAGATHE